MPAVATPSSDGPRDGNYSDCSECRGKGDDVFSLVGFEELTFIAEEDVFAENDPTTWVIDDDDDDDELREGVADYKQSLLARKDVVAELNLWKTKQEALQTKIRSILERSQQLEVQLSRIASDCADLQSGAAELLQLTLEYVALTHAF